MLLPASDFQLDIVDFGVAADEREHRNAVPANIVAVARRGLDRYSLLALLAGIEADRRDGASGEDLDFVPVRLHQTLGAMDAEHAKGRFACD